MTLSEARQQGWEPQEIPCEQLKDETVKDYADRIRAGTLFFSFLRDGEWIDQPYEESMFAHNILYTEKARGL